MFCSKCGNQIKEGHKFCQKCGNQVITVSNPAASGLPRTAPVGIEVGESKNLFFGLLGLLLLGIVFMFTPTFKIDGVAGMSKGFNMFDFEGIQFMRKVSVGLYLVSAGLLCVPLLKKQACRRIFLLPSKITAFWTAAWFLFLLFISLDAAKEYSEVGLASLSLPFTGWFLVICTVATIVVSFMLSSKIKRAMRLAS